jgi:VanZ family protein
MLKTITYAYFLIITYLFLTPAGNTPPLFWGFDKLVHFTLFAILTFLIQYAFKPSFKQTITFWLISITFYALLIEILQYFMQLGRSFSVFDIFADLTGALIVFKLTNLYKRF